MQASAVHEIIYPSNPEVGQTIAQVVADLFRKTNALISISNHG